MSGTGFIKQERPSTCELCQAHAELRPYGPRGARICFECMRASPESESEASERFARRVAGETPSVLLRGEFDTEPKGKDQ